VILVKDDPSEKLPNTLTPQKSKEKPKNET